jgi:hypothetical protein
VFDMITHATRVKVADLYKWLNAAGVPGLAFRFKPAVPALRPQVNDSMPDYRWRGLGNSK